MTSFTFAKIEWHIGPTLLYIVGIMYEISKQITQNCLISAVATNDIQDMQIIFDYRNVERWSGRGFFGTDVTNYSYVGEIEEMGIPCRLFHGLRKDFPYGSVGFTTLWEWCIEKKSTSRTQGGFPAISLTIYFQTVNNSVEVSPRVYEGDALSYHFYNVQQKLFPLSMFKPVFDIGNCYSASHRTNVAIGVPVDAKIRTEVIDATNNVFYVYEWFESIEDCTKSDVSSLRISDFHLLFRDDGNMWIFFTILDRHPDLPKEQFDKELDMGKIYDNLAECITKKSIKVTRRIDGIDIQLIADKIMHRNVADS